MASRPHAPVSASRPQHQGTSQQAGQRLTPLGAKNDGNSHDCDVSEAWKHGCLSTGDVEEGKRRGAHKFRCVTEATPPFVRGKEWPRDGVLLPAEVAIRWKREKSLSARLTAYDESYNMHPWMRAKDRVQACHSVDKICLASSKLSPNC